MPHALTCAVDGYNGPQRGRQIHMSRLIRTICEPVNGRFCMYGYSDDKGIIGYL